MMILRSGARVALRGRKPDDLELYLRWRSQGEWRSYDAPWEGVAAPATDEDLRRFKGRFLASCQATPGSPRKQATIVAKGEIPLGWVNRYGNDRFPHACCVGIDICEDDYLNRGLGSEALWLWVDYLFDNADLRRIGIDTWSLNPRMVRVAEKLGFVFEGAERELIEWQGKWLDRLHYGLLRSEWEVLRREQRSPKA